MAENGVAQDAGTSGITLTFAGRQSLRARLGCRRGKAAAFRYRNSCGRSSRIGWGDYLRKPRWSAPSLHEKTASRVAAPVLYATRAAGDPAAH